MPDEMSPGEIGRTLKRIDDATSQLRSGFDNVRETIIRHEHQIAENAKDIAALQQQREKSRQSRWETFKQVAIPISVGIVLGGAAFFAQLWAAVRGVTP